MQYYTHFLLGICCLFSACLHLPPDTVSVEGKYMDELLVPDGFAYSTTRSITLKVSAIDNHKNVLTGLPIQVYLLERDSIEPRFLMTAWIGSAGFLDLPLVLSPTVVSIIVESDFPGLPEAKVDVSNQDLVALIMGENNQAGDRSDHALAPPVGVPHVQDRTNAYNYLGGFDALGVPYYLTPQGEIVGQDVLELIAANLPEGQSVPINHPEYLSAGVQTNISLIEDGAVWVYFLDEGSRNGNALGYYTYDSNNPPQNVGALGPLTIVYPNVSFPSSGGNLHTGDKVFLGTFTAGTTIAWFLVPDGWAPLVPGVQDGSTPVRFSDADLNTFTDPAHRNHSALLLNPSRELLLLGFEESTRPGGDNDFNDAVFGIRVEPYSALEQTNLVQINSQGIDSDGDGVPDYYDREPVNPAYAFSAFSPTATSMGTLVFEDFWPAKGDYDLNDMVVDYRVEERQNAANQIVQILIDLRLRAMGASFRNGLGFDLNVPASKLESITGSILTEQYITLASSGGEAGQSHAVAIAFDNGYSLLSAQGGGFVNTEKDKANVGYYDFQLNIVFNVPVSRNELGMPPYNPFLIARGDRGVEVHLPRLSPTDLANFSLFGTKDDDSTPGSGKSYLTNNNLPWALHFPESFPYPIEKVPVNQAYLRFNQWAESGGGFYPDWYKNDPGNQVPEKIY